jgi:hypothetical protein
MTENEARCRIAFSEELLRFVQHAREINCDDLLIGDESWLYYEYSYDSALTPSRGTLLT